MGEHFIQLIKIEEIIKSTKVNQNTFYWKKMHSNFESMSNNFVALL